MKLHTLLGTCAATLALHVSGIALAGGEGWSADFSAAKKQAADEKKDLLMDFTGSDWCGWCIKLNKEVFSHEEFKEGVKDKFVLVELDYPRDKSKLSAETIAQNEKLGEKYAVKGYPTILLADAEGRPYAATGYRPNGPEDYVKYLDELRARKAKRDEAFAKAADEKGVEKAKDLVAALKAMDLDDSMVANSYGDVVEQIKAADPQDETGFTKAAEAKQRLAKFQTDLRSADIDAALILVNKTIDEGGFEKSDTQQLVMTKAMIFAQQKKFDEALATADEAKAVDPEGEMAANIDDFKKRLQSAKEKAATDDGKPAGEPPAEEKTDEAKAEKGA